MTTLARNKKARFDFEIIKRYIAGITLLGSEVKAIREGKMNLVDAYCLLKKGQLFLVNAHIGQYSKSSQKIDPYRERQLLLEKKELETINRELSQKKLVLIPIKIFSSKGWLKLEIGLARKKKKGEKRQTLRQKAIEREMQQELKHYR